jgi:hypothetical protein
MHDNNIERLLACFVYLFNPYQATCCVVNDQEAKLGLLETLSSQGIGVQATIYLSSIDDCYDDNTAVCDEYGHWCQTLYRLDSGLDDTISKEIEATCTPSSRNSTTTSPRSTLNGEHKENCSICNTLSCCYAEEDISSVNVAIQRKRKREHITLDGFSTRGDLRDLFSNGTTCDSFTADEGSLNSRICSAYAPYCNPLYSQQSTESIPPTVGPSTATTKSNFSSSIPASNTSYYPTMALPSYYPTISVNPSSFVSTSPFYSNSTQTSTQLGSESPTNNPTIHFANVSDSPTQTASTTPSPQLILNETFTPSIATSPNPTIGPVQSRSLPSAPSFLESPQMDNTGSSETSLNEKTNSSFAPSLAPLKNESMSPFVNVSVP